MLSTGDVDVVTAYSQVLLLKHYLLASCIILFFDYFLTLAEEVAHMWSRADLTNPVFWLFVANRYVPMLSYLFVLAATLTPLFSTQSCQKFIHFPPTMMLFSEAVMGALMIIRTNALYSGNKLVLSSLLILYIAQIVFGALMAAHVSMAPAIPRMIGCLMYYPNTARIYLAFLWPTTVVFDSLLLALAMYSTLRLRVRGVKVPLLDLIARDGIVYFAYVGAVPQYSLQRRAGTYKWTTGRVMFLAKIVNWVIFFVAPTGLTMLNWVLNNTITVIMISRIVMNIRAQTASPVVKSEMAGWSPESGLVLESGTLSAVHGNGAKYWRMHDVENLPPHRALSWGRPIDGDLMKR